MALVITALIKRILELHGDAPFRCRRQPDARTIGKLIRLSTACAKRTTTGQLKKSQSRRLSLLTRNVPS